MTERGLKVALGLSVALNVFVIGAVAGGLIVGARGFNERPHRERPPVIQMVQSLDEADRSEAEQTLRRAGLAARSDFETARRLRGEAIELAGAESFDRAAVEARLNQARAAEMQGRVRLEESVLDLMGRLDQADRERLAPSLARRGREGRAGGPNRRRERTPSEPAAPRSP